MAKTNRDYFIISLILLIFGFLAYASNIVNLEKEQVSGRLAQEFYASFLEIPQVPTYELYLLFAVMIIFATIIYSSQLDSGTKPKKRTQKRRK